MTCVDPLKECPIPIPYCPAKESFSSLGVDEWLVVVEPFAHWFVLIGIKLHLYRFQRLHVQDVIGIIQRWFFIVKRRKTHPFEVASIALLASHHNPHRPNTR